MLPGFWIRVFEALFAISLIRNSERRTGVCITWCIEVFYKLLKIFCHFAVVEIYKHDLFFFPLLLLLGHHWQYNISWRHLLWCSLMIRSLILVTSLPINKRLKILLLGVRIRRSGHLKLSPFFTSWNDQTSLACFSDPVTLSTAK